MQHNLLRHPHEAGSELGRWGSWRRMVGRKADLGHLEAQDDGQVETAVEP
jgi:hypothetical protein